MIEYFSVGRWACRSTGKPKLHKQLLTEGQKKGKWQILHVTKICHLLLAVQTPVLKDRKSSLLFINNNSIELSQNRNFWLPLFRIKFERFMLLFPERLHQLREEKQLFQKDLADVLSIDTPAYCRIEKGERRAKREQVISLASYLQVDKDEFLVLWLTDQISSVLSSDKVIAHKVLSLVAREYYGKI